MPTLVPVLLFTSHILLVADTVPKLNYEPSCRAAVETAVIASRDLDSCKNDEEAARVSLEKVWTEFTASQRGHCVRLTTLGGPPSYVELITCLEMARDSSKMRDEMPVKGGQIRR